MLETKLLQTFREVAVRGSFSAAAESLAFTQPAVSQHISRLEKMLDARLLERDARGVKLTPAGEVLLRYADGVLDSLRRAEVEVRSAAGVETPKLRVGSFATAAAALVPNAFKWMRDSHPSVQLELALTDSAAEDLAAGRIDVGIVCDSDLTPLTPPAGVEFHHLHDDEMLIALPVGHRLAGMPSIDVADLASEPWLTTCLGGTCADSNIVMNTCRDAGFMPDIRLETDDYQAIQGLVGSGMGVAVIPSLAAVGVRGDLVIRPIRGRTPKRRIIAAVRTESAPLASQLVEALRAASERISVPTHGRLSLVA